MAYRQDLLLDFSSFDSPKSFVASTVGLTHIVVNPQSEGLRCTLVGDSRLRRTSLPGYTEANTSLGCFVCVYLMALMGTLDLSAAFFLGAVTISTPSEERFETTSAGSESVGREDRRTQI